jgi:ketosteroid isomerase-like protein
MSDSIPELAVAYSQAWANHDPDAIVALHTEDSVFHLHDIIEPWVGREAIRTAIAGQFADSPDLAFEPVRAYLGDDHFVAELTMSGTRDGKEFSCDAVDVLSVKDGLVARKDSYIDWVTYQQQTGVDVAAVAESA